MIPKKCEPVFGKDHALTLQALIATRRAEARRVPFAEPVRRLRLLHRPRRVPHVMARAHVHVHARVNHAAMHVVAVMHHAVPAVAHVGTEVRHVAAQAEVVTRPVAHAPAPMRAPEAVVAAIAVIAPIAIVVAVAVVGPHVRIGIGVAHRGLGGDRDGRLVRALFTRTRCK